MALCMARHLVLKSGAAAGGFLAHDTAVARALERPAIESCERLYWALDGRDIVVLGKRWHLEVFSVVELSGRRYMQLSLDGPEQYMLTLRLVPETPVNRLIPAILSWLAHPTASGEVLDVR